MGLQLALHQRQAGTVGGLQVVEKPPGTGALQLREGVGAVEPADRVEVRPGRPAPVVADAVAAGHLVVRANLGELGQRRAQVLVQVGAGALVLVRDPVGEHPGPVRRLPPERRTRQRQLARAWPHEQVAVQAALAQQLRQRGGMPEGVQVAPDGGGNPELGQQPALPVERLAHQRLAARQVAVRLDPPPTHDLEPPLGDPPPDLPEQLGVVLLHPREKRDRVAGEHELRVLPHALQH